MLGPGKSDEILEIGASKPHRFDNAMLQIKSFLPPSQDGISIFGIQINRGRVENRLK